MHNGDLEKTLDTWAEHELESAPEMQPTAKMYRMVEARAKKRTGALAVPRWAAMGAVAASLVVLLAAILLRSYLLPPEQADWELAYVGLRDGSASEKGVIVRETAEPGGKGTEKGATEPPARGDKKGPMFFDQLMFQFQLQDSSLVEGVDLLSTQTGTVVLTSADNYRLFMEPGQDTYVYVFQLTPNGVVVRLFPDHTYAPSENPLREGKQYYMPARPTWLHVGQETGQERLYIIVSVQPQEDLMNLYTQYIQSDDEVDRKESLSHLTDALDAVEETAMEVVAVWVFAFDHQ